MFVGAALVLGSISAARMADTGQEAREPHAYSPAAAMGGPLRQKLLSAPATSGLYGTAEAQATLKVGGPDNKPPRTMRAVSTNAGTGETDRKAIAPADTALPDPTVAILPTPLGLKSSTDIPDFSMAASSTFIVTANSQTIYVQDASSNILNSATLSGFFASLNPGSPFGPHLLYDDLSGRFVIAALDGLQTNHSSVLLGVSDTSDPTATWTGYRFAADPQGQTSAVAMSSLGDNSTWIVLSTAMFQNEQPNPFVSSKLFVIDKDSLLTNKRLSTTSFVDTGFLPCPTEGYDETIPFVDIFTDWNGNSNGKGLVRHGLISSNGDQVQYTAAGEYLSFPTTWDVFINTNYNFIPQLGSSTGIFGGDGRITNAVFRNNMLYATHSVYRPAGGPDHMGLHWITEDAVTGAHQDGFLEGSGTYSYFSPSLAVSQSNDLLIAYNGSSANSYPSSGVAFRRASQSSFSYIPLITGTEPSLALRNGINVGATTSATCPSPDVITVNNYLVASYIIQAQGIRRFLEGLGAFDDYEDEADIVVPLLPFFQGTLSGDNGSLEVATGTPEGHDLGQFIFGNFFPSSIVGGLTLNGMQFMIPSIPGSVEAGQTINIYYGPDASSLSSPELRVQPYTVEQRNQFVTFNFPMPIQVPVGQGFFAGISGPPGLLCIGVDTNLPLYGFAQSSSNFGTTFSRDPFNYMIRLTTAPPCRTQLAEDHSNFDAHGSDSSFTGGRASCKPTVKSDYEWIVVKDVSFDPDQLFFSFIYEVKPNNSPDPRVGFINVGGQSFDILQASNNPLPQVKTTPNSASVGGSGFKLTINPSGQSSNSILTPSAAGFTSTTTVAWNGEARPTTVVSPTELSADISAKDLATAGTAQVTIFDLAPGGGTSPPVTFTISSGPDFSLSADQPTVTAQAGTKARVVVNINRSGGFTGNVTVTPPDPASGIKAKPPDPVTTTDQSVAFKFKIAGSTPPGSYQLVFKGKDDSGRERDVTVTLVVQ
jgi:hypothetical protein